jgi:ABC-type Fe3+-hydroxamate transport system substrate-binding protein
MKNKIAITVLIYCVSICLCGCKTQKSSPSQSVSMALPPAIVYKTVKDYSKNVAIYLSEDKKTITGYPAPTDVSIGNYPTLLKKGYLLDNRGIGKNIAFISLTYEEYAALKKLPSIAELENMIIDRNPIKEMYFCGNRAQYSDVSELNKLIDNKFKGCQRVK